MTLRGRYHVQWTYVAEDDLNGVIDYIAKADFSTAVNILNEIRCKTDTLCQFPERGRIVPELQAQQVMLYRELIHKSWRIMYRIEADQVYVLAVLDARRNTEDLLLNRLIR
jgi:toxin ParE1/3/4